MKRPPDSLKAFCNGVAQTISSPEGRRLARDLQLTGLLGSPPDGAPDAPPDGGGTHDRVGIWERRKGDRKAPFVRRMDRAAEWSYWANVGRIEPKGVRWRIVLIGESVARGYLYDPQLTPAMALSRILESRCGSGEVEVVDLARTNLGFDIEELAAAALLLEPDAVVLFAGNNWRVSLSSSDLPVLRPLVQAEGVQGLKRLAEERLAGRVRRLVSNLAALYGRRQVPLLWIMPEFNLLDWRDPVSNAPHLLNGANRRWLDLCLLARQELDGGDPTKAATLAEEMLHLDQGVTVAPLYTLAECRWRCGDLEAARRYLELARDAVIWEGSREISPRPYSVAQETLREEAAKHGHPVVSLPKVFHEYLEGDLPGRRLFLDYCHLTSEGIEVAMAAAAAAVLQALAVADPPWRSLLGKGWRPPTPDIESGAAFLAAVHNAHWWQPYDLVYHHCLRAVRATPAIVAVMTRFIDIQIRRAPMSMCRAAEELAAMGSPLIRQYLLRSNNQQLDRLLISALVAALAEVGVEAGAEHARLLREEHSLTHGAANLLDYYYCSAALQPQEAMWVMPKGPEEQPGLTHCDYYKAFWFESRFVFVAEAGCPVRLRLTCRLPDPARDPGRVSLEVNGKAQGDLGVTRAWTTWELPVEGEAVVEGVNDVLIRWPIPELPGQPALEKVVDDLLDDIVPEMFCVFGEIHAFIAVDDRDIPRGGASSHPIVEPPPQVG